MAQVEVSQEVVEVAYEELDQIFVTQVVVEVAYTEVSGARVYGPPVQCM